MTITYNDNLWRDQGIPLEKLEQIIERVVRKVIKEELNMAAFPISPLPPTPQPDWYGPKRNDWMNEPYCNTDTTNVSNQSLDEYERLKRGIL